MVSKVDLISRVHEDSDLSKQTIEEVVRDFLAATVDELASGNTVRIPEIGTFSVSTRKAHQGYNPSTGARINVPAKKVVRVKISRGLTRKVRGE